MRAAFVLLALCAGSALSVDVEEGGSKAIAKIMTMLKDMIKQLGKEAEEDADMYEQMQCWCKTNDAEKTKSISDGEARIKNLNAAIEEYTASSATLSAEIKQLEKENAKNTEALASAKALRTKQLAEFNAEEKDSLASIGSLKSAVVTLGKHNSGASFIQMDESQKTYVMRTVQYILQKHRDLLSEVVTPHQRRLINSLAGPKGVFLQQPGHVSLAQGMAKGDEASGEIFGILTGMKESFEINLANSQQEETANQKAYEDLKAAKEEELAAGTTSVETKTQERATADTKNAESKEDKEDTEESVAADTKFLADVKEKCANMDAEYAQRTKDRQLETEAVTKALSFLTSDEAQELFARTTAASFVQKQQASARREKIARAISRAGGHARDPRLSAIAMKVRLANFDEVKAKLQAMIDTLTKEKEEEIEKKDFCIEEFNKNSASTEKNTRDKDSLNAKIDDFTQTVADLTKAIETLKQEMKDLKENMKRAGEDRELANKDFQIFMADQRATEKILTAALNILKGFYEKAALVELGSKRQPAFKEFKRNENSGGVMGMFNDVISETKQLEADAMLAEEDAQTAYETMVKDTNESLDEKTKDMINKSEANAKAQAALTEATVQRDEVQATLDQLASELHDLHIECDFLTKNWDIRTEARDEEIEALKQGLGFFSGATFSSFLQSW
jgi:outer membrane murein-binding lipoprotein Lpp